MRNELSVHRDLVFRGSRLMVPISLRKTLVVLAHENHRDIVQTKQRLRELYWFPGMDALAQSNISACTLCQSLDRTAKTFAAPLQPVPLPAAPWTKIGLDIVGPFETWPEVAFIASIASEVMIGFLANIFSRYGNPESVVNDNGPQLISPALSTFFKDRNIRQIKVSASNGAVERFNRVLKSCVQAAVVQAAPWKETMTAFLQTYRATPHSMTNASPFELMFGRKMRTKLTSAVMLRYASGSQTRLRSRHTVTCVFG